MYQHDCICPSKRLAFLKIIYTLVLLDRDHEDVNNKTSGLELESQKLFFVK